MSNKTGKMRGVRVGGAVGLATMVAALAFGAGPTLADDPPVVATVADTTPQPAVTTAPVTTTAATTAPAPTPTTPAEPASTAPTTAATPTTTAAAVTPTTATLSAAPRPAAGCPRVGAVGLVLPQRPALVLGSFRQLSGASF